jgi:NADH-quinone oxidoreductase subunit E
MMTENKSSLLSEDVRNSISDWIKRYPSDEKRSGVFEALRLAQEQNGGSLTTNLMDAVADFLGMPRIAVYEVATFYSMYYLNPVGQHVINICTNISCSMNGADEIVAWLKKRLGVDFNEITPDGKFMLKEVECLGACVAPPVGYVGKKYYENLTPEKLEKMLGELS